MPRDDSPPPKDVLCVFCGKKVGEGELHVELKVMGHSDKAQAIHFEPCLRHWVKHILRGMLGAA